MPNPNQSPQQGPEQTPDEVVANLQHDLDWMRQAVASGDIDNVHLADKREALDDAAARITPHWYRYDTAGGLVEISRDEAGPDQPPSSYTLGIPNGAGDVIDADISPSFAKDLGDFLHASNKARDAEAAGSHSHESDAGSAGTAGSANQAENWPTLADLSRDAKDALEQIEAGTFDPQSALGKRVRSAAERIGKYTEWDGKNHTPKTTYTVKMKTGDEPPTVQTVDQNDVDAARALFTIKGKGYRDPEPAATGTEQSGSGSSGSAGGGNGGNTLGNSAQGGNTTHSPEVRRGGEVLDNDIETLLAMERELKTGIKDVNRLMTLNQLIRGNATPTPDGDWVHVPADKVVWSKQHNRWLIEDRQYIQQFAPKSPNGKIDGKVWEQADTNRLIERLLQLTNPDARLIRDEQTRNRCKEIAAAQVCSPLFTDPVRESEKRKFQAQPEEPWGEGLLEWETAGDDDASIAAAAELLKSHGMSKADAEAAALQAAKDGYLRRTDPNKVQATILERVGRLHGYKGNPVANPERIERAMAAMDENDRRAILKQIVSGGREEADKQALANLIHDAFSRSSGKVGRFFKGIDEPEKLAELFGNVMGTFDNNRNGIWRHNLSEATRKYAFRRYQELTGSPLDLVYQAHTGKFGKYYSIKRHQPFQMDQVLSVMKIDALSKANMHDQLLAAKKTGAYAAPEIAKMDVSRVQPFGGPTNRDALGLHLFAMSHAREHGYGNNFLNYLYDLGESADNDDLARDWLLREGRDEGSKELSDSRRARFLSAKGALQRSAGEWLRLYESMWPPDQRSFSNAPIGSIRLIPGNVRVPRTLRAMPQQQTQQQQGRRNNRGSHRN